jgi:hypothetical protein
MPFIGTQPEVGGYSVLDNLTASATASYTLQKDSANFTPSSANQLLVSLNGVIQKPGSSFTVSGSTLTFSSALTSSDSIDFILAMGEPLLVGTPSDGTVTSSKLATDIAISGTLGVDGHASIGNSTTVAGTRALTVVGASDGSGSEILNCYNSSLASKFSVRDDGIINAANLILAPTGIRIGGSAQGNTLDDYEEGTWTPILTGYSGGSTQTYQYRSGKYTRIGRLVTCTYQVRLSAKGNISGNYTHLKGMPFANESTIAGSGIIHYVWALGTSRDNLTWEVGGGNTDRCWLTYLDGTTTQYVNTSDIGNSTGFMGTLVYYTDA